MSERVEPDVRRWIAASALYDRSTILRVIDEMVAALRLEQALHTCGGGKWMALENRIIGMLTVRARFEEADDD